MTCQHQPAPDMQYVAPVPNSQKRLQNRKNGHKVSGLVQLLFKGRYGVDFGDLVPAPPTRTASLPRPSVPEGRTAGLSVKRDLRAGLSLSSYGLSLSLSLSLSPLSLTKERTRDRGSTHVRTDVRHDMRAGTSILR